MTVYESDLPGVGKKFEVETGDGARLVIVTHNTGRREVFVRRHPDDDSEKLFDLSDRLARQVGTILEGAYFQPVRAGTIDTVLDEDTVLEWVTVPEGSPVDGTTLGESRIRQRTGATVVAIQRGDETIANPGADTVIQPGDTLLVLGSREACLGLDDLVSAGADDGA